MRKIILILTLSVFVFNCESMKIPIPPYLVTKIESIDNGIYRYDLVSLANKERSTNIITNDLYSVGDTIYIVKKPKP